MSLLSDTIVAPATPVGRSALAIVRIDGPCSTTILEALTGATAPDVRRAVHTSIRFAGEVIDDCVVVRYEAPHSFTGGDLVEITLHGNPLLIERTIEACVALGARFAEPGEFTERAVLNGKLDLVQAESIADLINARTALQAKLSISNLEGAQSRRARALRAGLLEVISLLEGTLDFSEEGYEFITREAATGRVESMLREVVEISGTYERGRATRDGLTAVILGRPNAGKSTLLNRLVGSDRAIVTPIPGTTRDIVRETVEIGGLPVTFADTAGLREGGDVVEAIGIERARAAAREAELVLYLVDAREGLTPEDEREIATLGRPVLLIHTRRDLFPETSGELTISAVTGEGMEEFLLHLDELVRERYAAPEGALVNERQRAAVTECAEGLEAALGSLRAGAAETMVVVDLYRAATALGTLTGAITREDVLSQIFSRFCIGK